MLLLSWLCGWLCVHARAPREQEKGREKDWVRKQARPWEKKVPLQPSSSSAVKAENYHPYRSRSLHAWFRLRNDVDTYTAKSATSGMEAGGPICRNTQAVGCLTAMWQASWPKTHIFKSFVPSRAWLPASCGSCYLRSGRLRLSPECSEWRRQALGGRRKLWVRGLCNHGNKMMGEAEVAGGDARHACHGARLSIANIYNSLHTMTSLIFAHWLLRAFIPSSRKHYTLDSINCDGNLSACSHADI